MRTHITNSSKETFELASKFSKQLKGGDIVLLSGELGSGKTTFVQGLAKAFGITEAVRSPTFILRQDFKVSNHKSIRRLVHLDFYRIKTISELEPLDLSEVFSDQNTITLIEWPERVKDYLWPKEKTFKIIFSHSQNPEERSFLITNLTNSVQI